MEIIKLIIEWAIPFACASGFAFISKKLKENEISNKAMKESQLAMIRSQIVGKCETYLEAGSLPSYGRYCLEELFKNYQVLGGNHGIEELVNQCYKLPPKKKEEK